MECDWWGRVGLEFEDVPERWRCAFEAWLPRGGRAPSAPEWRLRLAVGSNGVSGTTRQLAPEAAYDADSLYLSCPHGGVVALPLDMTRRAVRVLVDRKCAPAAVADVLVELLFLRWLQAGLLPVHAAALSVEGRGVLLPAWAGTGKTRLLLSAVREGRGQILGDEWILLADGAMGPARDHVRLTRDDVGRMGEVVGIGTVGRWRARLAGRPGRLRALIGRRRGGRLALASASSRGPAADLDEVVCLESSHGGTSRLEAVDAATVVAQIWTCFARERIGLFRVLNLIRAATQGAVDPWADVERMYLRLATAALPRSVRRLAWATGDDESRVLRLLFP